MNIGILYFAGQNYGLGHHYRSIALADELEKQGHFVYYFSNLQFRRKMFFQLRPKEKYDLYHILNQVKLDWLVIDTPKFPEDYIYEFKKKFNLKILFLNANEDSDLHEIDIIQGCLPGAYSGPQWVILRKNLSNYRNYKKSSSWFVFGGSEDAMNIREKFSKSMISEPAFLIGTEFSDTTDIHSIKHIPIIPEEDAVFISLESSCAKACISFGMSAWELTYFGVPTYAFSPTREHLRWAQAMEKEGLIMAYPDVGIPDSNKVSEFLHTDFEINDESKSILDNMAVERITKLMENYD